MLPSPTPLVRAVTQCDTSYELYLSLAQQVASARNWTLPPAPVFVRVGTPFATVFKFSLYYVWVGVGILGAPLLIVLVACLAGNLRCSDLCVWGATQSRRSELPADGAQTATSTADILFDVALEPTARGEIVKL